MSHVKEFRLHAQKKPLTDLKKLRDTSVDIWDVIAIM